MLKKSKDFLYLKITINSFVIITFLVILLLFVSFYEGFEQKQKNEYSLKDQGLGVKDVVQTLRSEMILLKEEEFNKKQQHFLDFKSFDLEISFVIKKQEKENGKFDLKFVVIEAGKEIDSEKTQKITLHMETIPPSKVKAVFSHKPISTFQDVIIDKPPN